MILLVNTISPHTHPNDDIIFVKLMNIYSLAEFKCAQCSEWFHPIKAQPMLLPCCDTICATCLKKKTRQCPLHPEISTNQARLNGHIQEALVRLMRQVNKGEERTSVEKLEDLNNKSLEDREALIQLLDRIYTNQINRISHLRNRVLRELWQPCTSLQEWKQKVTAQPERKELKQQAKMIEQRLMLDSQMRFDQVAQIIISDPSLCLQRHFSVYNMDQVQPRRTLKASVMSRHPNLQSLLGRDSSEQKANTQFFLNCVKTVDSPDTGSAGINKECKQLSSFKLGEPHEISAIEHTKLSDKQREKDNSQVTLRDCSKMTYNTRVTDPEREKDRPTHESKPSFVDLVNSLKGHSQLLEYSPEAPTPQDDSLLLEDSRKAINFLKECNLEPSRKFPEIEIKRRQRLDLDREKNKYVKKLELTRTDEAVGCSITNGSTLQLFNFDLKQVDLKKYFSRFDWNKIEVVKLVASGLQDLQFNQLLNCLVHTSVHTLLLPGNELQQISLDALLHFTELNQHLKTISLQRNNIHSLQGRTRRKITELKRRGVNLYL